MAKAPTAAACRLTTSAHGRRRRCGPTTGTCGRSPARSGTRQAAGARTCTSSGRRSHSPRSCATWPRRPWRTSSSTRGTRTSGQWIACARRSGSGCSTAGSTATPPRRTRFSPHSSATAGTRASCGRCRRRSTPPGSGARTRDRRRARGGCAFSTWGTSPASGSQRPSSSMLCARWHGRQGCVWRSACTLPWPSVPTTPSGRRVCRTPTSSRSTSTSRISPRSARLRSIPPRT